MSDNPLDELIDDIKTRPVPYAAVAAAGVAVAIVLASQRRDDAHSRVRGALHAVGSRLDESRGGHGDESVGDRVRDLANQAGLSQSTAAVFVGTLLSKALTGWLRLRAEERARSQAAALSEASGRDVAGRLHEHTVAELRELAAERDISGRSTMNKDELVDAIAAS